MIGVGNDLRGDDAAGLEVVRRLVDLDRPEQVEVREGAGAGLLDLWDGACAVVLVDSVRSGAAPGTLLRIDASTGATLVGLRGASSHSVGVAEAIELARALGRLPPSVVLYGVEGASFGAGADLTAAVAAAIDPAAHAVREEVQRLAGARPARPQNRARRPAPAMP